MGKKYIIELEPPEMFDERKFYQCTQMPWWAVSENIVENLTPYTEPDLEQVRKEAYEQGRKDGKIEGRAETWACVKKIAFNPESVECVDDLVRMGFDVGDGNGWSEAIEELFEKYTASEAIEKIRQYEQEKEEQDGLRQNIQTIVDQCGYTLDEIAEVLAKMKEASDG